MHRLPIVTLLLLLSLTGASPMLPAQVVRDPKALAIATQAYKALGGALPADSRAIGTYERVVGSFEDSGSIEVLTRGSTQTSEQLTNSRGNSRVVYSGGYASRKDSEGLTRLTLEESLASISPVFPLVIIAPAVLNPNSSVQLVGTESLNGQTTYHIRISLDAPDHNFAAIAALSAKDVWVATSSGLPVQVAYKVLYAEGSDAIAAGVFFSNYKSINGTLYPLQVQEFVNGTLYSTISVTSVAFNVGLSDQDFVF